MPKEEKEKPTLRRRLSFSRGSTKGKKDKGEKAAKKAEEEDDTAAAGAGKTSDVEDDQPVPNEPGNESGDEVKPSAPSDPPDPQDSPPERGRKMSKSGSGGGFKSAMKENIMRPMSSLLRRPGSRAGSRDRSGGGAEAGSSKPGRGERDKDAGGGGSHEADTMELPEGETKARPTTALPKKPTGSWSNGHLLDGSGGKVGSGSAATSPAPGSRKPIMKPAKGARPSTALSLRNAPGGGAPGGTNVMEIGGGTTTNMLDISGQDIEKIEDITGYEFGGEVANAPSMAMTKMGDIALESSILQHAVFSSLEPHIDLSLLLRNVIPEPEAKDEEQQWTWDYLFTDVTTQVAATRQPHEAVIEPTE